MHYIEIVIDPPLMQVHMDNLALLRKPLDELQREIPSMADLDDESETNIAEVNNLPSSCCYDGSHCHLSFSRNPR